MSLARVGWAGTLVAALLLAGCRPAADETPKQPTKDGPMLSTPTPPNPSPNQAVASPYQLATRALEAYRNKDLAAWGALLFEPLAADATADQVFTHELTAADRVKGIYIQRDTGRFSAVIRTATADAPALWFELIRAPGGGFLVEKVMSDSKNPAMNLPVEG